MSKTHHIYCTCTVVVAVACALELLWQVAVKIVVAVSSGVVALPLVAVGPICCAPVSVTSHAVVLSDDHESRDVPS
jgi:hypothetical protein